MGLPQLDTQIGDISLTDSGEDLRNCRDKGLYDEETKGGEVKALGNVTLTVHGTLGLLNIAS